jgi:hypothetical protein
MEEETHFRYIVALIPGSTCIRSNRKQPNPPSSTIEKKIKGFNKVSQQVTFPPHYAAITSQPTTQRFDPRKE